MFCSHWSWLFSSDNPTTFIGYANLLVALATVGVAIGVWRLSKQNSEGEWLKYFGDIQSEFWKEPDIRDIRIYLTQRRQDLIHILEKNETTDDSIKLNPHELDTLDKFDRYLNLLEKAIICRPILKRHLELWKKTFFHYWIELIWAEDPIKNYVKKHYYNIEQEMNSRAKKP